MSQTICYLGDDDLCGAAIYLAGVMTHFGLRFDHVASTESPGEAFDAKRYALYVISDYPAANFSETQLARLVGQVESGSGLLMLGGWESFHGQQGEYHRSPLVDLLPVYMADKDDRQNCAQPCLIEKVVEHPILADLPFDTPPGIGGFNAFTVKPDSTTLLNSTRFAVSRADGLFQFAPDTSSPLLVIGHYGRGHTAALATDVAPHWVGGFVDWGNRRVVQQVDSGSIEVGNWYAQFFRNLLVWTGQLQSNGQTAAEDNKPLERKEP